MKTTKKLLAICLAAVTALSVTACKSGRQGGFAEAVAPDIDPDAETGTVTYLTYETNFTTDSAKMLTLFKERYNGEIEVLTGPNSMNYYEMLGTRIATGDSPDLVRYEQMAYPHGMSFNMFTPLDKYIDLDSDLWKGIKDTAEQFAYNGKHFYVPYTPSTYFALNYNYVSLQSNGMEDPMEYVKQGTWDWDKFEDMLKRWQNMDPVNHISYNGVSAIAFAYTTGVKIIDIKDGEIINNLRNEDIVRCMQWLESLRKQYLTGANPDQLEAGAHNGYTPPEEAFVDGNLLFLGMEPTWTYGSAKEALDKKGIENEMKFIPFPRDPLKDTWYQATSSYGYLIPAGAKNVKGAMDWITLLRTETVDPDNVANAKAEACDDTIEYYPKCASCGYMFTSEENEAGVSTCPSCDTPRNEKYKVVWTEEQWDVYQEMLIDGEKYTLMYDNLYGFSTDFKNLFVDDNNNLLTGVMFMDLNYTQRVEEIWGSVEGYLQPYRDRLAADAAGEEVTTTPPQDAQKTEEVTD